MCCVCYTCIQLAPLPPLYIYIPASSCSSPDHGVPCVTHSSKYYTPRAKLRLNSHWFLHSRQTPPQYCCFSQPPFVAPCVSGTVSIEPVSLPGPLWCCLPFKDLTTWLHLCDTPLGEVCHSKVLAIDYWPRLLPNFSVPLPSIIKLYSTTYSQQSSPDLESTPCTRLIICQILTVNC